MAEKPGKKSATRNQKILIFASIAVVLAGLIRFVKEDPSIALKSLPIPLGLLIYGMFGGEFPPFLNHNELKQIESFGTWSKENDVFIAACGKCGTTWTLNIGHQIRSYQNETLHSHFEDILDVAPWPALRPFIGGSMKDIFTSNQDVKEFWDNPAYPFRVFKSQYVPTQTPIDEARDRAGFLPFAANRKYVVVVRNPVEQLNSALHFMTSINRDALNHFGIPNMFQAFGATLGTDPSKMTLSGLMLDSAFFLYGWAPYLCESNVFLLHYSDLKKNPEQEIKRLAAFLDQDIPEDAWSGILDRVSYKWMKKHGNKFLYRVKGVGPLTKELVREGKSNAKPSKISPEQVENLLNTIKSRVPENIYDFALHGGELKNRTSLCHKFKL